MEIVDSKKSVLIITGMHRSGTSLVASLLQSAGVDIGDRLMEAGEGNVKGTFENLDFVEFHREVLFSQGISQEGWTLESKIKVQPQFIDRSKTIVDKNSFHSSDIWGWKDPRTTLFLDFWNNLLPESKFLLMYRSPWEVVDSLYRRGDEVFFNHPEFPVQVWMNYNRVILEFYDCFSDKCLLLNLEDIVSNYQLLADAIEKKLGLSLSISVASIYDKSLLHRQISSSHRPSLIEHYFPDAIALYDELNARAKDIDKFNYYSELTQVYSYSVWAFQDWLDLRRKQKELKRINSQLEESQAQLQQTQAQLQQTQSEWNLSQNTIQETKAELARSQGQLKQTQREWELSQQIIQAMESSKFWKLRKYWFRLKQSMGLPINE
ncbi:MAG TPA: chromosome partitioning protein ParA [Cyanobacteria bacterium UBA11367]|nr:chromosome partitioning protein ParA [Cyanobacteria bacterium UBA11367]HBE59789.1 chromosome partitioning protein ParA [Cyanobacteria bacterium UBA11366]